MKTDVKIAWEWSIFSLLLLFGIVNIVSTYPYLSHLFDEAPHIATGMQWWWRHAYSAEPLHPPLVRLFAASLLFFAGKYHVVSDITSHFWWEGSDILYADDSYVWNLALARLGVLPFFILSCFLVYRWSSALYGVRPAMLSLALYVTLPTIAAHAGVAMTDMGYATMLCAGIMASLRWLKNPSLANSLIVGLALALMVCSKYSALMQFPAAMAMIGGANYIRARFKQAFTLTCQHIERSMIALLCFVLIVSSLFLFSYHPLVDGLYQVYEKNKGGHATWLFHKLNGQGVWYFFPVVYFFKTPITFLIANLLSIWRIARERQNIERLFPVLAALGIFLISMPSNINIGIRHVLPVYMLLAVPSGYGILWVWEQNKPLLRSFVPFLLAWQATEYVLWFPDRLAYYNSMGEIISGGSPEHISPDNDVDAGQGFILLGDAIERHRIQKLYACFWLGGSIRRLEVSLALTPKECPSEKIKGWFVISRVEQLLYPEKYTWLAPYQPMENVGKTLLLYYIE